MILQIFFAFAASLCFSVIFNVDKKEIILCGLTGAVGWLVYILCHLHFGVITSTLISTICITILARILANTRRNPITVFLIPGIIPLVPGAGLYYTMYNIVISNNMEAALKGIETLKSAGAIAIGIILVLTLPRWLFFQRFYNKSNKG